MSSLEEQVKILFSNSSFCLNNQFLLCQPQQFDHIREKIAYLDGYPTPRQVLKEQSKTEYYQFMLTFISIIKGDNLHTRKTRSISSSPSASPRSAWNPFKFGGDKNKKLLKAVQDADMDKVKKNLDKGADIESRDHVRCLSVGIIVSIHPISSTHPTPQVRYTPLILAASRGNAELVELLLSKGADIEASDMVCVY